MATRPAVADNTAGDLIGDEGTTLLALDLYLSHFNFSERPFTLQPDPDFVYWSDVHKRAFAVLEYGIMTQAPLTVVTGEVGTGKTTLVHLLLRQIDADMSIALISNAKGGRGDLLRWILNAFDVETDINLDYVALFQRFQDFVVNEYAEGRHVVIIFDEAQNLTIDILEELRMLTNINANKDELLQLILVGQPELRELIHRPDLRQFAQRVTAIYHLEPLNRETMGGYIRHRLRQVGGSGREITADAMNAIFHYSEGVPRIVNKICDVALVYAANAGQKTATLRTLEDVITDGLIMLPNNRPFFLSDRMRLQDEAAE